MERQCFIDLLVLLSITVGSTTMEVSFLTHLMTKCIPEIEIVDRLSRYEFAMIRVFPPLLRLCVKCGMYWLHGRCMES